MFLEVANPTLLDVHMHGQPFTSVFAHDSNTGPRNPAAPPKPAGGYGGRLDPKSPYNDMGSSEGAAPAGMKWPVCTDSGPQAPHRPFNANLAPNHFYRLEFLRVEGDDFQTHWKEWYPYNVGAGKTREGLGAWAGTGTEILGAVALPDRLRFDTGRAEQLQAAI